MGIIPRLARDSLKLLVPFIAFEGVKLMISCQVLDV